MCHCRWSAIGPEMNRLYKQVKVKSNVKLYLPESFEWIILQSGYCGEKGNTDDFAGAGTVY